MRKAMLVFGLLGLMRIASAQQQMNITVKEGPPEAIPTGACTPRSGGYLGIVKKDGTERTALTDQEIGEYVRKTLAQGYSISLYPQASGKTYVIETCHSNKH